MGPEDDKFAGTPQAVCVHAKPLMRAPDFQKLFLSASTAQLGAQVTLLAFPLVAILDVHASAVQVGLLASLGTIPYLLLGLPPAWEHFDATRLAQHRYVAVGASGTVLGWVAASPVSERCVYAGVIEDSVYVHPKATGKGIGLLLLKALICSAEAAGIWTIQCGVFPENLAGLAVHHRAGFRDVGVRHRLSYMAYGPLAGQWRDVILLERRSPVVGTTPPSR